MKLYTEEQVMEAYNTGINDGNWDRYKEDIVALKLTPIELPSDEEIRKEAKSNCEYNQDSLRQFDSKFIDAFTDGVKWMKDKILNQNK